MTGHNDRPRAGLAGWERVESRVVRIGGEDVGYGLSGAPGASPDGADVLFRSVLPAFVPMAGPEFDEAAVSFEACPQARRLVRIVGEGLDLDVSLDEPSPDSWRRDAETGGLLVDLSRAKGVVLQREAIALALAEDPAGVRLDVFRSCGEPPLAPATPIPAAPVEAWAKEEGDPWLAARRRALYPADDAWSRAASVGMYARLLTPSKARLRASIGALLDGKGVASLERARRYALALTSSQLEHLGAVAFLKLDALRRGLALAVAKEADAARTGGEPSSARRALLELARRRERLEWMRRVLVLAGAAEGLDEAAARFDAEAAAAFAAAPPRLAEIAEDEELSRAAARSPEAWWLGGLDESDETPAPAPSAGR